MTKANDMQVIKLQKDTTLTIRVNSLVKAALAERAEQTGQNVTELLTNLALRDMKTTPQDFKNLALGKQ